MTGDAIFGLSHESIEKLKSVFRRYPKIEKVIIYGSRAKGTFKQYSDIDLAIIGTLSLSEWLAVEGDLDDLLLIYKIDLSNFADIENQNLIEHINRVGQVFYERDH